MDVNLEQFINATKTWHIREGNALYKYIYCFVEEQIVGTIL